MEYTLDGGIFNGDNWKVNSDYKEPEQEKTEKSFSILKSDSDKRLVFGWASIAITVDGEQLEDRQQDMIDPEDLEEAVYDYVLNFRDTGEEHIPTMRKKGKLVESCVFTVEKQKAMGIPEGVLPVGWWIGFKIEDDDAWERIKNGTYRMFSIEGKANREPVEKAMPVAKTFNEILKFNLYHGRDGRFTSAGSATSFTYAPGKSKAHDMAIAREKERHAAAMAEAENNTPRMKAIHSVEDKIRGQSYESAAVIDKDGNTLFFKDGAESEVRFNKMECLMMRNNTLTHNHPHSTMFSTEDVVCMVRNDMLEMRATTSEGTTYSIKRGEGYTTEKGVEFVNNYNSARLGAHITAQRDLDNRGFREKISSGEITHDQANKEFGRVVTKEMVDYCNNNASNYGIDFSIDQQKGVGKSTTEIPAAKSAHDDDEFVLDAETNRLDQAAFEEWLHRGE